MKDANFIPAPRLRARERRRRLTWWTSGLAAYAAALLAASATGYALWAGDADEVTRQQEAAGTRIRQSTQTIRSTQRELEAGQRTLDANRTAEDRPDWSVLLVLVARSLGDDVVLVRCDLAPEGEGGSWAPGAPPVSFDQSPSPARPGPAKAPALEGLARFGLRATGYARTTAAVFQFVLALEQTRIFDQVKLLKTARQPFLGGSATCFEIECLVGERPEEPQ